MNTRKKLNVIAALFYCASPLAHADLIVGDQRGDARSVMEASGVLSDLTYKITWKEFPNAAPLLEALDANYLDAGSIGDAPLTFAVAAGAHVKGILAFKYSGNAVIVSKTSTINTIQDLVGKRIATVRGSSGHATILSALAKNGVAAEQVKFVYTTPAEATLALTNGDVEAVATWEPYVSFSLIKSGARIVVDGRDYPSMSYFAATPQSLEKKSAELKDFAGRLAKARQWASDNPSPFAVVVAKNLRIPEDVAASKVKREGNQPLVNPSIISEEQQKTIDLYVSSGLIKNQFNASDLLGGDLAPALTP